MEKNLKKYFKNHKYYPQYICFGVCFEKKTFFLEKLKKNIFPNFSQYSEFQWDNGDGDVGGDGGKFFMGKCCENEMAQSQHMQKPPKKVWATFPMLNFSGRTPTLGVPKIWDNQKSTFLTHFFNFGPKGPRGPKCD